ncbi:aspartate kinase [Brevibacillus humidisoli]|uniref:aspartate kinase n=1 Tax=Brevibacillus humidisoli TaxID=2895522 RepID=UPI001E4BB2B8|nr:aspartate kinase [Brevibacillus humidisoli]UFJ41186.1 aspartate kinase [Brevibacillus humidisoli]
MALLVQKYGGTSVGSVERIEKVADRVMRSKQAGQQLVVVLSAMGKTTDTLTEMAGEITGDPSEREIDMLLSTGEQVSVALLALALQQRGCDAVSLTGWQAGITTDSRHSNARILSIDDTRIQTHLQRGQVVIVAGYQGLTEDQEITTLGRGGSDTSAVALAASLRAEKCQIFTDVEGVYTADPRVVPLARKIPEITYQEMLELSRSGAAVLHPRAVETARNHQVPLEVRSSFTEEEGTHIGAKMPASLSAIRGIAHREDVAVVSLKSDRVEEKAPAIARILAAAQIETDPFLRKSSTLSFTVPAAQLKKVKAALEADEQLQTAGFWKYRQGLTKVSMIGHNLEDASERSREMAGILAAKKIPIDWLYVDDRRISYAIPASYTREAMQLLHSTLGLDNKQKAVAYTS